MKRCGRSAGGRWPDSWRCQRALVVRGVDYESRPPECGAFVPRWL